ncbi:MAG TPA: Hpt domain-containing protein [Gemmatimonadales bacterium]
MTQPPPSGPSGAPLAMGDFFALEAGEYLERLDAALQAAAGGAPAVDELLRLARALRGSALMASKQPIARAAAGLETLVRAVKDGRKPWDAGVQQVAVRAVDDLKIFVRASAHWTEADSAKADALAAQLEQAAGGRVSGSVRAADAPGLDAGARAFVAREGAAIASALDRAAQVLRANPLAHDPLQHVMKALQPLRGLAALNDLPPLPDLLEGIERAIGALERSGNTPIEGIGDLFQAGAGAIAAAARQVADRGRPDPEGDEFRNFAGLLVRLVDRADATPDVQPITNLYYDDAGPHIVQRGTPAARPATLGRLELVSHGEHLRQAADSLERAPSATQRELRAHTLAGTFRALADVGGGALAAAVGEFAMAAREAVTAGLAVQRAPEFSAELRKAGDVLARSSTDGEAELAGELTRITDAIRGLRRDVVPIQSLAPGAPPAAAPALRLVPAAPAPAVRPVGDDDVPPETPDMIGSWVMYARLVGAGVGPASLEELLAAAGRVPAPPPAADTRRPAPAAPAAPAAVDIRALLYRGDAALRRAQELRAEARAASGDRLRALVDEVCDLVGLALDTGA